MGQLQGDPRVRRPHRDIPDATVARLAVYLGVLNALHDRRIATVSSVELARAAGVNPPQLRKDLSLLGSYGTRGVGYDVDYLRFQLDQNIGASAGWLLVIVGVGNLGRALISHAGFLSRGFTVQALFDSDPALVGEQVEGLPIHHVSDLPQVVEQADATIGVIATPASAAQQTADQLVAAGVRCLLNFAPVQLVVSHDVTVRRVDLGSELQILAYHRQMSLAAEVRSAPLVSDERA